MRMLSVREHRLAAAIALAVASSAVASAPPPNARGAGTVRVVTNCSDADQGSLRDVVENIAQSGDIVDLGQLPALCGSADSTITLTSGEISAPQYDLTLQGPPPGTGTVTISGNGASRVLNMMDGAFSSSAYLHIRDLAFTRGHVTDAGNVGGGCIKALLNVALERTSVTDCVAESTAGVALGGGIYTGILILTNSTISGNTAHGATLARGGGVAAGTLESKYSTLSANVAVSEGHSYGGAAGLLSTFAYRTTFDHNAAEYGSAIDTRGIKPSNIRDSTISGNTGRAGAIRAVSPDTYFGASIINYLRITNCTVAFNASSDAAAAAIVFAGNTEFPSFLGVTLESSIIANNTAGDTNAPADVNVMPDVPVDGHDNLVIASNVSPPGLITVTSDPLLGPLQDNGGPTLTHALLSGSPAIAAGNADTTSPYQTSLYDQRGPGFPRSRFAGGVAVTDIGATQHDTLFANGFD